MTGLVKQKVPLSWAAQALSLICDQIDESGQLDEAIIEAFNTTSVDLAEAIDRRKAILWAIEGNLTAARGARAELDAYVQKLKAIQEKIEISTKDAMEANPDLSWKDSAGRKITLSNSAPALKYTFDLKEKRSFTGLVTDETINMFHIEPKYLNVTTVKTINSAALKSDLLAGKQLVWVGLERGKHVRGLKPKLLELNDDNKQS